MNQFINLFSQVGLHLSAVARTPRQPLEQHRGSRLIFNISLGLHSFLLVLIIGGFRCSQILPSLTAVNV